MAVANVGTGARTELVTRKALWLGGEGDTHVRMGPKTMVARCGGDAGNRRPVLRPGTAATTRSDNEPWRSLRRQPRQFVVAVCGSGQNG